MSHDVDGLVFVSHDVDGLGSVYMLHYQTLPSHL